MKCKFCGKEIILDYDKDGDIYVEECGCVGELAERIFGLRMLAYDLEEELMSKLDNI